jgi:molybdopterin-guanine dinucleotide biosynthesis protein A
LAGVCGERIVVAKRPEDYAALGLHARFVSDGTEAFHPLAGVAAGLRASRTDLNFVFTCDAPLLRPELVRRLAAAARGRDAAVPLWAGRAQPLCAVYDRRCAAAAETLLREGSPPCARLLERLDVRFLSEEEIAVVDREGESFQDVDTPEDHRRALSSSLPCAGACLRETRATASVRPPAPRARSAI